MSNYGDLDHFVNEAEWELADYEGEVISEDDDFGDDEPSEPRPYWNGVPH